jgi:AcrR family transcriptional regulator
MPSGRKRDLSRDKVLSAAMRIVDEEGADALTMRRLARELGVEAMSLYNHVADKQALLEGVVELALTEQARRPPTPEADWRDTVAAAVNGFRRALTTHPNVLPVMIAHPPASEEASRLYLRGPLTFLIGIGFSERDAAQLFEAVFALAFGHAMLTSAYPAIESDGLPTVDFTDASFDRSVRVLLDGYAALGNVSTP